MSATPSKPTPTKTKKATTPTHVLSPKTRRAADLSAKRQSQEKSKPKLQQPAAVTGKAVATSTGIGSGGKKKKKKKPKQVMRVIAPLEKVQTMEQVAKSEPDKLFMFESDVVKERMQFAKQKEQGVPKKPPEIKPYHEQGDPYFDTHHMLIQRSRLRDHPDILLELKRFWRFVSQEPDATYVFKENYVEMHICVNKALRQDFEAQQLRQDLRNLAEWDWSHDMENAKRRQTTLERAASNKGTTARQYYIDENCMSKEAFYDGVFELVDLWTQTVIPDEYVSFLKQLRCASQNLPSSMCHTTCFVLFAFFLYSRNVWNQH